MAQRYCQALDLVNDPEKIRTYIRHHQAIWPEIRTHIVDCGIADMQIWRLGTRLFMIMETNDSYDAAAAAAKAALDPKVQAWEALMWQFQVATPWAREGEKWVAMEKIFDLQQQLPQP